MLRKRFKSAYNMKIYTKTGDKGKTSLIGGTRVLKNDSRLSAYGTVDELNSFIGLLVSFLEDSDNKLFLVSIQNTLFDLGATLAVDRDSTDVAKYDISFQEAKIERLESEIDKLEIQLEPLKSFVIPGGNQQAALCHVCRTVTRRVEREICAMSNLFHVDNSVLTYINRLSDYFFVLSRFLNKKEGNEIFYVKG